MADFLFTQVGDRIIDLPVSSSAALVKGNNLHLTGTKHGTRMMIAQNYSIIKIVWISIHADLYLTTSWPWQTIAFLMPIKSIIFKH